MRPYDAPGGVCPVCQNSILCDALTPLGGDALGNVFPMYQELILYGTMLPLIAYLNYFSEQGHRTMYALKFLRIVETMAAALASTASLPRLIQIGLTGVSF